MTCPLGSSKHAQALQTRRRPAGRHTPVHRAPACNLVGWLCRCAYRFRQGRSCHSSQHAGSPQKACSSGCGMGAAAKHVSGCIARDVLPTSCAAADVAAKFCES
eukprot:353389-Chlamydomonas_euryale.AAC.4